MKQKRKTIHEEMISKNQNFIYNNFKKITIQLPIRSILNKIDSDNNNLQQPPFNHHWLNLQTEESKQLLNHLRHQLGMPEPIINLDFVAVLWEKNLKDGRFPITSFDGVQVKKAGASIGVLGDELDIESIFDDTSANTTYFLCILDGMHRMYHFQSLSEEFKDVLLNMKANVSLLILKKESSTSYDVNVITKHLKDYSQRIMETQSATVGHTLNDSMITSLTMMHDTAGKTYFSKFYILT